MYRHYKGREYDVYGEVTSSSNRDAASTFIIIYRPRYGDKKLTSRPKDEFLEKILVDDATVPRFIFVREFDDPCLISLAKFFTS
ncbi:MAG: DUF1653 domain-containing protein [Candidatus Sungbacteria bacterium]|uniref:DUF1653 domain-containing protein n=1 Tax=Candidatus Sungiibacteriota bacterium TaxID=2750080 RepID=A0A932DS92_9BACT|nr:DUF1653 domain-containing protein [Candidatus Sungbacteria bacterium]